MRNHNPFTVKHIKIIFIYGNGMLNCLCVQFPLHFKMNISFGVGGWYGAWFHLKFYSEIFVQYQGSCWFWKYWNFLREKWQNFHFSASEILFQLTSSSSFNGSSEKLVNCTFRAPNPELLFRSTIFRV